MPYIITLVLLLLATIPFWDLVSRDYKTVKAIPYKPKPVAQKYRA